MSATDTYCDPDALLASNTSEEQRQFLRNKCRQSLYFLCKAVLGFRDFTPSIHLPAANFIQQQHGKRKLFMLPRSFFKSYLATIGYPVWLLIQEPDPSKDFRGAEERILIANATATNSEQFLSKIKSIFERNTLFQWLFPELIPDFTSKDLRWNVQQITIPRPVDYPEPTISTIGVGGAVVSRHYTRIILDDLVNDQHAASPDLMRKAIDWYKYTESLLEVSSRDELLVIGTRWSFNDLYSYIEENEGDYSATNPLGFVKHKRYAIEDDKPIFPERYPFAELQRLRAKYGDYMFSCLYLNNPRQPGVNDFNRDWLRFYKFGDKGALILDDGSLSDTAEMDRVLIIDIATSVRRDADFSAIVCIGIDPAMRVFVLEAWHGRVQTKNLLEQIFKFAARWRVRAAYYEDSAQQKLIQYSIEQHSKETGQHLRILPVKAGNTRTKESRIRLVQPYFEKGMVFLRESMADFMNEFADFPLGKHDDLIDAFAYFPRCVRFQFPEPAEETQDEMEDRTEEMVNRFELQAYISGRSNVTGY